MLASGRAMIPKLGHTGVTSEGLMCSLKKKKKESQATILGAIITLCLLELDIHIILSRWWELRMH